MGKYITDNLFQAEQEEPDVTYSHITGVAFDSAAEALCCLLERLNL